MIGDDRASCSPAPCQLRHREDVAHGLAYAPTVLTTPFAMRERAAAAD
jgi:hypothetical protein